MIMRKIFVLVPITILLSQVLIGQQVHKLNWHSEIKLCASLGIGNFKGIDDIPRENSENIYSVSILNGIAIEKVFLTLEFGVSKWGNDLLFPLSISPKFVLKDNENSPFLYGSIGLLLGTREENHFLDEESGRVFINLGIGYQFKLFQKNFSAGIGFENVNMKAKTTRSIDPNSPYTEKYFVNYQFIKFCFGIVI